ncbi:sulfite exporter TauE/SafE family protein [bacterium]|nr:sulfite exporter TauE/SafE family protein [bacterium]
MGALWLALGLGFAGSLHCVGMCGPIALSLPIGKRNHWGRIRGIALHNLGRIGAYALLGLIFGLFGRGLALAGLHRWVSIGAGALMMTSVLLPWGLGQMGSLGNALTLGLSRLKTALFQRFEPHTDAGLLGYGIINGWLPCGLVYTGILGSLAQADASRGVAFMVFFGLGTLPAMASLAGLGSWIGLKTQKSLRRLIPVAVVLVGALFVLRGLELGIPYLSPPASALIPQAKPSCH